VAFLDGFEAALSCCFFFGRISLHLHGEMSVLVGTMMVVGFCVFMLRWRGRLDVFHLIEHVDMHRLTSQGLRGKELKS
jgi:hypothetical protein